MRVSAAGMVGLLLLSLIQFPVQAESDGYVLYGIRTDGGYWITPNADDPNEGGLWGSSVGGVVPAPYAPQAASGREWILNMYVPEAPAVRLDPAGTIAVAFTIGGGTAEAGTFDAGWQLRQDGTTVVSGPVQSVTYTQDTTRLAWEVPAGIDALDLATLSLRVFTEASAGLGQRLSFADQPTISLPVLEDAAAAVIHYADMEETVTHAFANATSDTYIFNFTTTGTHGVLDLEVNGTGTANLTLTDGNGTELLNATAATDKFEFRNVTAGDWQLRVAYQNFTGNLSFAYLDGALLAPVDAPPAEADAEEVEEGNETLDGAPDDQESPAFPTALLVGLLGIMALRRRTLRAKA